MPRRRLIVTSKKNATILPEWATEYVLLGTELEARGMLSEIQKRLQISRRDGYASLDIVLFLLAYFCSGLKIGLRPFSKLCSTYGRQLAAVGGRKKWPSSSAVSRFLSNLNEHQLEEFESWFLHEAVGAEHIESHESIVFRDCEGEAWHSFDFDPTVTTIRCRALPCSEELPEPKRRSANIGAKGYPGRKRGDMIFSRATLQHAGSGMWLGITMSAGNSKSRQDNERSIVSVKQWCERTRIPLERAIIRTDGGAGGNVPAITAYQEDGVHHVTRLSRYEILEMEQVKTHLQEAVWFEVEDSMSGPKRQATELGTVFLSAGKRVTRDNGEPYDEVETRVIITRIPVEENESKRGAGIKKDGWWYELFSTSLPATAWPAPETVSLYYGRVGQENRFYQEDRELGLDRIFSYELSGQRFANIVGLFVWNLRIARGADVVAPMPDNLPEQRTRSHIAFGPEGANLEQNQKLSAMPTSITDVDEANDSNSCDKNSSRPIETSAESTRQDVMLTGGDAPSPKALETQIRNEISMAGASIPLEHARKNGYAAFAHLDWNQRLARQPGWKWKPSLGLFCPNDVSMRLHEVFIGLNGGVYTRWRAPLNKCRTCQLRDHCTTSTAPTFRKELCFTFNCDEAEDIIQQIYKASLQPPASSKATKPEKKPRARWMHTTDAAYPGHLQVAWPALLPSVLRHKIVDGCRETRVEIRVEVSKKQTSHNSDYFASTPQERQKRRKSWTWRHKQNQLPHDAKVEITLHGGQRMARLLGLTSKTQNAG